MGCSSIATFCCARCLLSFCCCSLIPLAPSFLMHCLAGRRIPCISQSLTRVASAKLQMRRHHEPRTSLLDQLTPSEHPDRLNKQNRSPHVIFKRCRTTSPHFSKFLRNFILFKSSSAEQSFFNDFVLSGVNPQPYSLDILPPFIFQRPEQS